jgi:phosphoribosylamine--glycine ligase
LAWKIAQADAVTEVFVAPGNAGTAREKKVKNIPIAATDIDALIAMACDNQVDLTVVGPEAPLVAGIVDRFNGADLVCFGPTQAAAQLEGSKSFTKRFLDRHSIPTAQWRAFTEAEPARTYVQNHPLPVVLKADGLAAGKGVVIARTYDEALETVDEILVKHQFGHAGKTLVIEEFLEGEEASFICIASGTQVVPLATSQDHKARFAADEGPNTGGMGAYSPAPRVDDELHERVMEEIIRPTLAGLADEGMPYLGFLYAGLMIDSDGNPKVLEYNCRFGDPETQPILMRLRSDLVALCQAAINQTLDSQTVNWDPRVALGVVMVADGYPGDYQRGDEIRGLDNPLLKDAKVFHAGTRLDESRVLTDGGRVLCVTALGDSIADAQHHAYDALGHISWPGADWRADIGWRAIARGEPQ